MNSMIKKQQNENTGEGGPVILGQNRAARAVAWLFAAVYAGCVVWFVLRREDHAMLAAVNARAAAHALLFVPLMKDHPGRRTLARVCRIGFVTACAAALVMWAPMAAYEFYRPLAGLITGLYYLLLAGADAALLLVARESGRGGGPAFFTAGYAAAVLAVISALMAVYVLSGVRFMILYEVCVFLHG